MAKRRKARVRGVSDTFMTFLAILAGSALGNVIDVNVLPKQDDTMVNIGEVALGLGTAAYTKGFISDMGVGMAIDGGSKLISSVLSPKVKGVNGVNLNRRSAAVGAYAPNGGGKMSAETFEVI